MIRGFTGIFEQAGLGVRDLRSNRAIEFGSNGSGFAPPFCHTPSNFCLLLFAFSSPFRRLFVAFSSSFRHLFVIFSSSFRRLFAACCFFCERRTANGEVDWRDITDSIHCFWHYIINLKAANIKAGKTR
jgi:hypothetical protein